MKLTHLFVTVALVAVAANAFAAPPTDTFLVTTTAFSPTQCGIAADNMNFNYYNPAAGVPGTTNADVFVACTTGRGYTVYPDNGLNALSNQTRMRNQSGVGYVSYDLYTNAARTTKWDTTNKFSGTGVGLGTYTPYTVYGIVAANQGAVDGSYDGSYYDAITVTVEFN